MRCWNLFVVAVLPVLLTAALAAECPGKENTNKPWVGTPTLLQTVANGSLYTAGDGDDQVYVLHVYGSPYSMGYAHGTLLKDKVQYLVPTFYKHVEEEMEAYIKDLPKDVRDFIAELGLDVALELTYMLTRDYTPSYFFEELHGLSDASGVDYDLLLRIHMLPELIKASCSMLGSWGKSAAKPTMMTQLRALDWDTAGPLQNVPVVAVYHPDQGNDFVNVGWAGWIATIAGVSSKGVAISQKHSDVKFGEESRSGIPFNLLMRDIIQFDNSLYDAMKRIMDAHRTCSIWLGVGDGKMQTFRLVAYSESTADFYNDQNVTKINASRFEREGCSESCYQNYALTDLVYWGIHLQCWQEALHQYYGQLDPAMVMRLSGLVQTGDLQSVIYDLAEMQLYVANARADKEQGPDNAYDRPFVQLDLADLFKQPRPTP